MEVPSRLEARDNGNQKQEHHHAQRDKHREPAPPGTFCFNGFDAVMNRGSAIAADHRFILYFMSTVAAVHQ